MEKTFAYLKNKIKNNPSIIYKIKNSWRLNKLKKEYRKLDFSFTPIYNTELDTEYIIFEDTGDKISLTWNIGLLTDYINKNLKDQYESYTIEELKVLLEEKAFSLYIENIENEFKYKTTLFKYKNTPILIMKMIPTRQYYVIDGKHRMYNAYINNQTLNVYMLNSDGIIPFLISPSQKEIYDFAKKLFKFIDAL